MTVWVWTVTAPLTPPVALLPALSVFPSALKRGEKRQRRCAHSSGRFAPCAVRFSIRAKARGKKATPARAIAFGTGCPPIAIGPNMDFSSYAPQGFSRCPGGFCGRYCCRSLCCFNSTILSSAHTDFLSTAFPFSRQNRTIAALPNQDRWTVPFCPKTTSPLCFYFQVRAPIFLSTAFPFSRLNRTIAALPNQDKWTVRNHWKSRHCEQGPSGGSLFKGMRKSCFFCAKNQLSVWPEAIKASKTDKIWLCSSFLTAYSPIFNHKI